MELKTIIENILKEINSDFNVNDMSATQFLKIFTRFLHGDIGVELETFNDFITDFIKETENDLKKYYVTKK